MTHSFDRAYWQQHWQQTHGDRPGSMAGNPPNPYLARETADLAPGTALDAGCGAGAEAIWLAAHGWRVTAADISADALARAAERAAGGPAEAVRWVEADLTVWEPDTRFDLVTTHYAHPAMPQLAFYRRLCDWVAPGGTLLIVGHRHTGRSDHGHGHGHPAEATVTLVDITTGLDTVGWEIVTAEQHRRPVPRPDGRSVTLHDVVVRATRRP
ncbi:class I SAM-dependent methyltransferase [Micromonospora sp. WMMD987]|jgi:SAM-dependent methyltransferase|uniref:class I SAM-dependent methyltransferase n=1 Tax=Micromonospora TaxID=1873 RepID=UPI00249BBBA0|nr:class I SAM-dependent methyltransferase [Micromonospora sp. WMMD987]WFE97514.1 class I SAM-dependent methyltransferase [Micromonospora sp. WMMD987]